MTTVKTFKTNLADTHDVFVKITHNPELAEQLQSEGAN